MSTNWPASVADSCRCRCRCCLLFAVRCFLFAASCSLARETRAFSQHARSALFAWLEFRQVGSFCCFRLLVRGRRVFCDFYCYCRALSLMGSPESEPLWPSRLSPLEAAAANRKRRRPTDRERAGIRPAHSASARRPKSAAAERRARPSWFGLRGRGRGRAGAQLAAPNADVNGAASSTFRLPTKQTSPSKVGRLQLHATSFVSLSQAQQSQPKGGLKLAKFCP